MLSRIEIETLERSLAPLDLWVEGAGTKTLQLKNVEGVGPVKADISTTAYSKIKGAIFNQSNIGMRNIVLTIGLFDPEGDIPTLRAQLYTVMMTQTRVKLRFHSDHMETVQILGHVEDCAPVLFTKDPEMQLSILCPDPDFVALTPSVLSGYTRWNLDETPPEFFDYEGTVPTAGIFEVKASLSATSHMGRMSIGSRMPHLSDPSKAHFIEVDEAVVNENFYLQVNTQPRLKWIHTRNYDGSFYQNLLRISTFNSGWPQLYPGSNEIRVLVYTDETFGQDWTFTYSNRYGGL